MGPPKQEDPNYIWLQEAGLTLARRVFHPPKVWPTKDVNKFIIKNLTLVKSQKDDLESEYFLFPWDSFYMSGSFLKEILSKNGSTEAHWYQMYFLLLPSLSSV